jgi:hypothetical protein
MMSMRTIQNNSDPDGYSIWKRTRRNVYLLRRMALMIYSYFVVGRRVRRTYREKEARGEIFYVDEDISR